MKDELTIGGFASGQRLKNIAQVLVLTGNLLALSACSSLLNGPGISVSQTNEQTQAVPRGTSPADAVIGRREHPAIVAAYGGAYSHRRTEAMLEQIVSRLLVAAQQPKTSFTITISKFATSKRFCSAGWVYLCHPGDFGPGQ